jgi:hypothetical protein
VSVGIIVENNLTDEVKCENCQGPMRLKGKLKGRDDYLVFNCGKGHQLAIKVSELKYGQLLRAVAETGNIDDFIRVLAGRHERVKEKYPLEVYVPNPNNPGFLKWGRNRRQSEVVAAVKEKLKEMGYYGGIEWVSPSSLLEDAEIPRFDKVVVSRRVGPNEGERVEVGVVSKDQGIKGQLSYFGVLVIKLFDKDLARSITDLLTDYLDA